MKASVESETGSGAQMLRFSVKRVILTLFLPVLRPLGYGLRGGTCLACFGAHDRMNIKKKSLRMPLFSV